MSDNDNGNGFFPDNVKKCGAKTRLGGECQQPAMPNGKCRMHGGMSLVGAAVSSYKHGKYSKYMRGPAMVERYEAALGNLDLVSMSDELALLETRMSELVERVETPEGRSYWSVVQELALSVFDLLEVADERSLLIARKRAARIVEITNSALKNEDTWVDIKETIEQKRKVAETEHSRLMKAQQVMTINETMGVLNLIVESIRRNVKDRDALSSISQDIARIVTVKTSSRD